MLTSFNIKLLMENKCSAFEQLSRCQLIAESAQVTCSVFLKSARSVFPI